MRCLAAVLPAVLALAVVFAACGDDDGNLHVGQNGGSASPSAPAPGDDGDGENEDGSSGDENDGPDAPAPGGGGDGDAGGEDDDPDSQPDADGGDDTEGDGRDPRGTAPTVTPLIDWPDLVEACSLLTPAQITSFLKQPGEVVNKDSILPLLSACYWQAETGEGVDLFAANLLHPVLAERYLDISLQNAPGVEAVAGVADRAYWQPINGRVFLQSGSYVLEILPHVSLTAYPNGEDLKQATIQLGQMVLAFLDELN